MHRSSLAKMQSFLRTYQSSFPRRDGICTLLDVGSRSFDRQNSYRSLIDQDWIRYVGLDLDPGENVDVVVGSGYSWPEFEDESIDVCISGQTFEHNPFFWATMAEISRILVPGGLACIIAPGAQGVHRFPVDCWRFFPDSWAALCALTGLEPLEIYFESDEMALSVQDGHNRDSMLIARKPESLSPEVKKRRALLTQPFRDERIEVAPARDLEGPCIADYKRTAPRAAHWRARLARLIYPDGPVRLFRTDDSGH